MPLNNAYFGGFFILIFEFLVDIKEVYKKCFKEIDMKKFSQQEINRLKELCNKGDIPFFFIPSSYLRDLISKDEHPIVQKLPDEFKATFLSGKGYFMHQDLIIKFLEGKADELNTFILSNGEIRIHNSGKVGVKDEN